MFVCSSPRECETGGMSRPRSESEGGLASVRTDDEKARSSSFTGAQPRLGGLVVTTDLTYSHRTMDEEVHLRSHEGERKGA